MEDKHKQIIICPPISHNAMAMQRIAKDSGVLSVNSIYFYALMARHFNSTSLVALSEDDVVGYVVGYQPPGRPDTVFVWQVGVDVQQQGKGLGKKLLTALIEKNRPRFLEATIAPDNQASVNLFKSVARDLKTDHVFAAQPFFDAEDLGPEEEAEHLMRIGPLRRQE